VWGVAKGAGFSCQEHLHLTGFGDLELVGLGAGFCLNKLEEQRGMREDRGEEMDQEKDGKKKDRTSNKVLAKRRDDFVTFRSAEGADGFEMKVPAADPQGLVSELGKNRNGVNKDAEVEGEMDKLVQGLKDMGLGKDVPKETEQIDDEIQEQDENDEDDNMSYEEYEETLRPIKNQGKILQLQARPPEDREFEDEVEYPATISLAEKFHDYRGMKSFRTSVWSKYVISLSTIRKGRIQI